MEPTQPRVPPPPSPGLYPDQRTPEIPNRPGPDQEMPTRRGRPGRDEPRYPEQPQREIPNEPARPGASTEVPRVEPEH